VLVCYRPLAVGKHLNKGIELLLLLLLGPYMFTIIGDSWDKTGDLPNTMLTTENDNQLPKTGAGPTLKLL
jgi:hypothetical protein